MKNLNFKVWDNKKSVWVRRIEELTVADIKNARYRWYQYTGVDDKNGKPIFEGDIVKIKSVKVNEDDVVSRIAYSSYEGMYLANRGYIIGMINNQIEVVEPVDNSSAEPGRISGFQPRDIRFKIWDNTKSSWVKDVQDLELRAMYNGRYAWYQYTGLKDRIGNLIYEGDLVRVEEVVILDEEHYTDTIFYCEKEGTYLSKDRRYVLGRVNHRAELVGDIHE